MKYVRVQMIMLAGFILLFVGAGIFDIANGTPLLPLQILWINFAIDVLLALGLGFDAPTPGLMNRRPAPPTEPVIAPALGVRLAIAGILIAAGTLIVVAWGEDRYGLATATTMGLTTISLLHIIAALEWRDPDSQHLPPRHVRQSDASTSSSSPRSPSRSWPPPSVGSTGCWTPSSSTGTNGGPASSPPLGYLILAELAKIALRTHRTAPRPVTTSRHRHHDHPHLSPVNPNH